MLEPVLRQAERDFDAYLGRLQRYIQQHSISAENRGIDETAAMVAKEINDLGGVGKVVPAREFPIVYGRFDVGAKRTVLVHSMYDTTPADEPNWSVPPFEGRRVADFEGRLGDCIVGRGTEDTKGPLTTVLNAIAAYRDAGVRLPCNVWIVLEASELGSGSLPGFVKENAGELARADVCFWPWHTERSDGTQVVFLRLKGIVTLKLRCRGGDWGGPRGAEMHGAHSTWVASPAYRLISALASMKTANDYDVAIEGFYDGRVPPTPGDEELVKKLVARIKPERLRADLNIARFKQDTLEGAIRAKSFQSEFNIAGLKSGYVSESGHKVIVPHEAVAALDMRPLDGMTVENMISSIRRHLDKHGFPDVSVELMNGYVGGGSPPENWAVKALLATYADCGIDPEVWPRESLAIAAKLFTDLGMPWIATLPGHANRRHSANEYIQVKGYRKAIEFTIRLFARIADAEKP
jgi:acetylornithine deacetylase/succinyl-diaminopimelate desuccinylase-like protein